MISRAVPSFYAAVISVWSRNFLQFRKSWLVSFFWILIEPLLMLLAFGYGLGSFIPQVGGNSYLEFYLPALLCSSVMFVSFFECSYSGFTKLSYSKVYQTAMLAPILPIHIFWGEALWGTCKGMMSAIGVILVSSLFGAVNSFNILLTLPIIFILSFIFSIFGLLITVTVKNYDQIIYPSSGLIVPLSLFSATYFPIENLPILLKVISYASPLTHAVLSARMIYLGQFHWIILIYIIALISVFFALSYFVSKKFTQRLIK